MGMVNFAIESLTWLYLFATIIIQLNNVTALKLKKFFVPKLILSGEETRLECEFDLEGDLLYSAKWYRCNKEFYRFVPAETRVKQVNPQPGILVNVDLSDASGIYLTNLSHSSSGNYKCEILTETNFKTIVKSDTMTVIDKPKGLPLLNGGKTIYHPGELVAINCTSPKFGSNMSLVWFLNGEKAPDRYMYKYPLVYNDDGSLKRTTEIRFVASRDHFPDGHVALSCKAEMEAIYESSSYFKARLKPLYLDFHIGSSTGWQGDVHHQFLILLSSVLFSFLLLSNDKF